MGDALAQRLRLGDQVGVGDNDLNLYKLLDDFEYEFGTSKQGGDGQPRFTEQSRPLNQFILHSSLDIVEEVQWTSGQMYVLSPLLALP